MSRILFIKNMVCDRCKQVVKQALERLNLTVESSTLGEVKVVEEDADIGSIAQVLKNNGFELLDNEKDWQVEKIKNAVIRFVQEPDRTATHLTFSHYLQEELGIDYRLLSPLFSSTEGVTIERYLILQRIEKVKEYLTYGELTMGQIAERMNYRSSAYLSSQFKKVTGITPSQFKKLKGNQRKPLDKVLS